MISKIFGFSAMVGCLAVIFFFESSSTSTGVMRLFHWPALVLTGVGPMALVILCYGFGSFFRVLMMGCFGSPVRLKKKAQREAIYLQNLSRQFYEKGAGVFESVKTKNMTPFVGKVLDRLSVRMPTADVRELAALEQERMEMDLAHTLAAASAAVRLTPSIGMLGTIMGMVRLLSTLDDPSHIGEHMSLALLTTFFGLFFSLAIWTPLHAKLEKMISVQVESCEKVLHWLALMERRKPDSYFEDIAELPKKRKSA